MKMKYFPRLNTTELSVNRIMRKNCLFRIYINDFFEQRECVYASYTGFVMTHSHHPVLFFASRKFMLNHRN
jgi:hypothetical protein